MVTSKLGCLPGPWTNCGKLSNQEWILTISKVPGNWMRTVACDYCHTTSHHCLCLGLPWLAEGPCLVSQQLLVHSSPAGGPLATPAHPTTTRSSLLPSGPRFGWVIALEEGFVHTPASSCPGPGCLASAVLSNSPLLGLSNL